MDEKRREFLALLGTVIGGSLIAVDAEAKKLAFKISRVKRLEAVNGWAVLKIKGQKVMFVRDTSTSIRAFSPICRHKQCTVGYNPKIRRFECGCHGSKYDLDGKVLNGPAKDPLIRFPAKLKDGRVILTLK